MSENLFQFSPVSAKQFVGPKDSPAKRGQSAGTSKPLTPIRQVSRPQTPMDKKPSVKASITKQKTASPKTPKLPKKQKETPVAPVSDEEIRRQLAPIVNTKETPLKRVQNEKPTPRREKQQETEFAPVPTEAFRSRTQTPSRQGKTSAKKTPLKSAKKESVKKTPRLPSKGRICSLLLLIQD